jgi:alcohol dehydrogenase (NADP+)
MATVRMLSGHDMPKNALGTWRSADEPLRRAVIAALNVGVRHIDTARLYFNEKVIGDAISDAVSSGVARRDEIFIASKVQLGV